jgi:Icc-related predicted phosphoesterase
LKIALVSDTHGSEYELKMPKADMLIHCGDYSAQGTLQDLIKLNYWFGTLKYKYILCISGNHDMWAEGNYGATKNCLSNAIYLENELVEIEGYKFYGSPVTPAFNSWAFNKDRGEDIARVWRQIPEDIDVLITHGPPKGILDRAVSGEHFGCDDLLYHAVRVAPTAHCFGHIHESYGKKKVGGTTFINCSNMNENYDIKNKPVVMEI